jgi:GTPase SAR1 family protein
MKAAIYIIGAPGVGKTTLTNALISPWEALETPLKPVKHTNYRTPNGLKVTQLGHAKPPFGGTDTLSYTAINLIEPWLHFLDADYLYAEGDRLANPRFFDYIEQHTKLHLFYLRAPQITLIQRRTDRAAAHDLPMQNPSWANGRATKHQRLAYNYAATTLDATLSPSRLAQIVNEYIQ